MKPSTKEVHATGHCYVRMGHLIRSAVEAQYGLVDPDERLSAVRALGALSLPVDAVEIMKAESDPLGREFLP